MQRTHTGAAIALALLACSTASAQERMAGLRPIDVQRARIEPIRAAVLTSGFEMHGGWVDYAEAVELRGEPCGQALAYDAYQFDSAGEAVGADTDCGLVEPYVRFLLNEDTCHMRTADDFTLEPALAGNDITRIAGGFYWYGDGVNAEQCYIVVQVWETIDTTCNGPALDGFLGAVVVDMGMLEANTGIYNTFDFDICAIIGGAGIPAPADGSGAVDILLANEFNPAESSVTLATCAQPMLWGTASDRPGSQTDFPYWIDVDRSFEFEAPGECFTFEGFAECPDNLGNMIAIWVDADDPGGGGTACGDGDCNGATEYADMLPFIYAVNEPATYLFYECDAAQTMDHNGDGVVNNFDLTDQIVATSVGGCQ